MSNLKILFDNQYPKLSDQKTGKLLWIEQVRSDKLDPRFVCYDTVKSDGSFYVLPNGYLLSLVFIGDAGIPFTTLRKATAKNHAYYEKNIGKEFDVVVKTKESSLDATPTSMFDPESNKFDDKSVQGVAEIEELYFEPAL
jgi:hypothetical protein